MRRQVKCDERQSREHHDRAPRWYKESLGISRRRDHDRCVFMWNAARPAQHNGSQNGRRLWCINSTLPTGIKRVRCSQLPTCTFSFSKIVYAAANEQGKEAAAASINEPNWGSSIFLRTIYVLFDGCRYSLFTWLRPGVPCADGAAAAVSSPSESRPTNEPPSGPKRLAASIKFVMNELSIIA